MEFPWAPEEGADLPGYLSTPADELLVSIYGDFVHARMTELTSMEASPMTSAGKGVGGEWSSTLQSNTRFLGAKSGGDSGTLSLESSGACANTTGTPSAPWCSPPSFCRHHEGSVGLETSAGASRRRQMSGTAALVNDRDREMLANAHPRNRQANPEATAQALDARILSGQLWSAVRHLHLTSREGGGVLQPTNLCNKFRQPVAEVLHSEAP
jgi:hypothetical protein